MLQSALHEAALRPGFPSAPLRTGSRARQPGAGMPHQGRKVSVIKLTRYPILRGVENFGPICYPELKGMKFHAMGVTAMPME